MSDDISFLLEFLEQTGPEVRGRGLASLRPEQSTLIERFIAGACTAAERDEIARFLQRNPGWIRWIADRVKSARSDTSAPGLAAG